MSRSTCTQPQSTPFVHEALFYHGAAEFLTGVLRFIHDACAAGEPVLVAVPQPNIDLLRPQAPGNVRFVDMATAGRNPGRIIPAVLYAFVHEYPERQVAIIGEQIWPCRSPAEYTAAVQDEALINLAFVGRPVSILCPYDACALDPQALAYAEATHPFLTRDGDGRQPSSGYRAPAEVAAEFGGPLPAPPKSAATVVFSGADLREVRSLVERCASQAGLSSGRCYDLRLAVTEVATNTLVHTSSPGTLRCWLESGSLVCEISDSGHVTDPLVGRIPTPPEQDTGRGLLLVNHLCDLVQRHTCTAGTTTRLHIRLDETSRPP
ncbi:MAG: anti-sigma factor RsbA family regulatory protein [Carbonactinosporaceae bacterium]